MKPLLLIKTGGTILETRDERGDFEDWFAEALGYPEIHQVDVFRDEALPGPDRYCAALVTGSTSMVSEKEGWSEETAAWLAEAVPAGFPVLGVCYGHQLLAHALGGEVGPNPNGRQMGTKMTQLNGGAAGDLMFGSLPGSFKAQTTHVESVLRLPEAAVPLASTPLDPYHAFRIGNSAWGVQFHPEFNARIMSGYIESRKQLLIEDGLCPDTLHKEVTETPLAYSLIRKFITVL
jgi:GMP synthase (glutamine-hydrolysing)